MGRVDAAHRYARANASAFEAVAELLGLAPEPREPECYLPPALFAEVAASCGAEASTDAALRASFTHEGVTFFTRAGAAL